MRRILLWRLVAQTEQSVGLKPLLPLRQQKQRNRKASQRIEFVRDGVLEQLLRLEAVRIGTGR